MGARIVLNRREAWRVEEFFLTGSVFGKTFYVDSGSGGSANDGLDPDTPLATIDQAVAKCTADQGDVIVIAEGHVEDLGSGESIDLDVAGITVVGLGTGTSRPRIDFNATNALLNIGASNVTLRNITLRPSVALVAGGISVTTLFTDVWLDQIEILPGEAGDGTDEFVDAILVAATCTRFKLTDYVYSMHASGNGQQSAVHFSAASDGVIIDGFKIDIIGSAAVAGIESAATLTRALIQNGTIVSDNEPGITIGASTGIIKRVEIFSDVTNIDDATVATGMAHFEVWWVEVGNEANTQVKTPSIDG